MEHKDYLAGNEDKNPLKKVAAPHDDVCQIATTNFIKAQAGSWGFYASMKRWKMMINANVFIAAAFKTVLKVPLGNIVDFAILVAK